MITRELAKEHKPHGLKANRIITKVSGEISNNTKKEIEEKLGKKVINSKNNLNYKYVENKEKIGDK